MSRVIIVITGQPHSGKSTLLQTAIEQGSLPSYGFVTLEIRKPGAAERSGFELLSSEGERSLLAGVDVIEGPSVSRYKVDLQSLESFLGNLRDPRPGEICYIDEVGQMELFSPVFSKLLRRWINTADTIICTASQVSSHPVIDNLLESADIIIEISPENRGQSLGELLSAITSSR